MAKVVKFFDKLEDKTREHLSQAPILYAIIGGIAVVLFWRAVWHIADMLEKISPWGAIIYSPVGSLVISVAVLLATGLFVSFFIGDRIILSGLKHEKKVEEKTESEVREEEAMLTTLHTKLDRMSKELEEIKTALKKQ